MVRNSFLIIAAILFASLFLFGCTGSNNTVGSNLSGLDATLAKARVDNTKLALRLGMQEDNAPFSGNVHFVSSLGKKSYRVPEFAMIDRDEVCGGSDGKAELYDEVFVTFDDSPAGETWSWGTNTKYCDSYVFYLTLTEAQMEKIKHPENPDLIRAESALKFEKGKILLYVHTENGTLVPGNATFVSPGGNRTVRFDKYGIVSSSDFCDGNKTKYTEVYFAFDASPIGETRYWSRLDYCLYPSYGMQVEATDLESMKDPRFDISLFEYDKFGGNPVNATLYCGDTIIGPLIGGHVNASKTELLAAVGATNCTISFIGNFTIFEKPYRFNFCGWTLDRPFVSQYSYWAPFLDDPFEMYLRRAPCDTPMSFVTPDDTMVKYRLQRYMAVKTTDTYMDLDNIRHYMEKDFGYTSDKELFKAGDWWQLPTEFMSVKSANKGDCEDWAVSFLSLAYAREPTRCWGMGVGFMYPNDTIEEAHVSVFCDVNGVHKIYDQTGVVMEPNIWDEYFKWFDYNKEFTNKGVVRMKPYAVFNNTFYSQVKDVSGMYSVLGIKS